jgi:hypothetical protein
LDVWFQIILLEQLLIRLRIKHRAIRIVLLQTISQTNLLGLSDVLFGSLGDGRMTSIRFKKGNKFIYLQNEFVKWGIPSDIEFEVEFLNKEKTLVALFAPKYGNKPYGDGPLFIAKDAVFPVKIVSIQKKYKPKKKKGE